MQSLTREDPYFPNRSLPPSARQRFLLANSSTPPPHHKTTLQNFPSRPPTLPPASLAHSARRACAHALKVHSPTVVRKLGGGRCGLVGVRVRGGSGRLRSREEAVRRGLNRTAGKQRRLSCHGQASGSGPAGHHFAGQRRDRRRVFL